MKKLLAGLATGWLVFGVAGLAEASLITETFHGVITAQFDPEDFIEPVWGWENGDTISGYFQYDSSSPSVATGILQIDDPGWNLPFELHGNNKLLTFWHGGFGIGGSVNIEGSSFGWGSEPGQPYFVVSGTLVPSPEPATLLLLGTGLTGLLASRKKKA